jgi:3-oxoacyl-[acyl-carrier protein] reductase
LSLKGKTCIVTGGSSGIGFEISKTLSMQHCRTIVTSRNVNRAIRAVRLIGGNSVAMELDISNSYSVRKFAKNLKKNFTRIDILINNAGYPFKRRIWFKKVHELSERELSKVLEVDLLGSFRITKEIIKMMLLNGGVIINISSTPAISGHDYGSAYSIAKAGLVSVTKHLALEYGSKNIRAYTIALGNISTDATYKSLTKLERKKANNENAMKRWGKPEEVAKVVSALASDSFTYATGNTIVVDGGFIII